MGFREISVSSEVAPIMKIVSRGDTTVVDAYLNPVLRQYLDRIGKSLGRDSDMQVLTSAGGLVSADGFRGKDSILSGPAGGVVGVARVSAVAGFARAIGFDMGGTSTDVSRYEGTFDLEYESEKAGVRIVSPMMAIETVAAGGGSVCGFDGVKLTVGPQSSGADPGPACYGRGGPLTVTDLNLFTGKILVDAFPFSLNRQAVQQHLDAYRDQIATATGRRYSPIQLADGFLRIANTNMIEAIRSISIANGCDPRDYVLVAFGAAAPQHACAVARELGIRQILNHPDAGILSALGTGLADIRRHRAKGIYRPLIESSLTASLSVLTELAAEAVQELVEEGFRANEIDVNRFLDLRFRGLDAYLTIPEPDDGDYRSRYEEEYERLYGYLPSQRSLEIVAARVEAVARNRIAFSPSLSASASAPQPTGSTQVFFDANPHDTPIFERDRLQPGARITGPAIVLEELSTTVLDPGWQAEVLTGGELLCTDVASPVADTLGTEADPVMLEVFNKRFAAIAEQMGKTLQRTASSVNVKERLDFSCAIFTIAGDLVVNAPHIPVHLGSMAETVRHLIATLDVRAGDVVVTNDPYQGGSHLPDVTVVTPVHDPQSRELLFFVASRAHHAEIGGVTPGSMPPFSTNLAQEGVLIRPTKVIDAGRSRMEDLRELLVSAPYPTRNIQDNLADISAQMAANSQGAHDLLRLVRHYSWPVVRAYMQHIQEAAERKTRGALASFPDGEYTFRDHLDDGAPIAVTLKVNGDSAHLDFTGTGGVLPGNLNANRAIVLAATMYCLRCLIDEDIPLNQGVLAPIELVLPVCLLNPPGHQDAENCAALAGGNVETSQRVVDVILGALGIAAASQGTMNNLLFGDASFGYYETICGGAGATPAIAGADAVQTHMTNTRLTDPEVLENRFPVLLHQFAIRRGSGGQGRHRGGDGVIRRIEFLRPLEISIVSQRRGPYPPYGIQGGAPGSIGKNSLERGDGTRIELAGQVQLSVQAGDILTIETPGGGACG